MSAANDTESPFEALLRRADTRDQSAFGFLLCLDFRVGERWLTANGLTVHKEVDSPFPKGYGLFIPEDPTLGEKPMNQRLEMLTPCCWFQIVPAEFVPSGMVCSFCDKEVRPSLAAMSVARGGYGPQLTEVCELLGLNRYEAVMVGEAMGSLIAAVINDFHEIEIQGQGESTAMVKIDAMAGRRSREEKMLAEAALRLTKLTETVVAIDFEAVDRLDRDLRNTRGSLGAF